MKRTALLVLSLSIALDIAFGIAFGFVQHIGVWNGLYFATSTATTVGYGDITPHGAAAHLLAVGIMLTVIPLVSAVFSLLTTVLTARHVDSRHEEMKQHLDRRHAELKAHVEGVINGKLADHPGVDSRAGTGKHATGIEHFGRVHGHDQSSDAPSNS